MGGIRMSKKMMLTIALMMIVFIAMAIEVEMGLSPGWNLVAIPCSTGYINIYDLLPIVPPAYKFVSGSGYVPITGFPRPSEGFWALALGDTVIRFYCECVDDTLEEARLLDYESGDSCLEYWKSATDTMDSIVSITVEGCVIHILHNAIFNCCYDSATAALTISGDTLIIHETEFANSPCFCICPFEMNMDIQVGHNGEYWIRIINPYWDAPWEGPIEVMYCY